ncbi:MAG TPA: hypothetical protein P5084_12615 [Paludibacter sp.]|nr:hypothetical protein [Paludibacter sp.]
MKKKFFILLAIAGLFASCKVDEPEIVYESKFISFGFYAEDNNGVIFQDYVIDTVKTNAIAINLPDEVDKTALVARFTTSVNDVVTVGTVAQVSKVTANNFSAPVDYIVTEGTSNIKYTVTIGKAPSFVWSALPALTTDSAVSSIMKVNKSNGLPYFMYKQYRTTSADQKAAMIKFENNAWVKMGEISEGQVGSYYDLTFSSDGKPYVSYLDYLATVSQANSVSMHNGTSWSYVGGSKGVTTNKVSYNALSFTADNKLMLFSTIDNTTGPLARRELGVSTFASNAWTINQAMAGRAATDVTYLQQARLVKDTLYVGIFNAITPNSYSLYQYANGAWTTLLDKWKDDASTTGSVRDFDLEVDAKGRVYLAIVDNSSDGATLKQRVVQYNKKSKTVSALGSPISATTGGLFDFDLAVSPFGVPYMMYRNESKYPTVSYFDDETQTWIESKVFETSDEPTGMNIDFASNGVAFASYVKNRKLITYKFSAPQ